MIIAGSIVAITAATWATINAHNRSNREVKGRVATCTTVEPPRRISRRQKAMGTETIASGAAKC